VQKYLEKLERMKKLFEYEQDMPDFFWKVLEMLRSKLLNEKNQRKKDVISPFEFKIKK
jgi:hypothetical protein